LPHVDREVQKLYAYPQQFARDIFDRVEQELRVRAARGEQNEALRCGRLSIKAEDGSAAESTASLHTDLPARYIGSSDKQVLAADKAVAYDQDQLLHDRVEGYFLLSFETSGGWVAVSKDILTEVLGAGEDAEISGLPAVPAAILRLMCRGLVQD
jgi:hypothetical protein